MKAKALALLAVCLLVASQVQAMQLIAGWDFSQSCLEGNLCDPLFNPIQTLPANYSDLDPTLGMGAESADFGTMHVDGTLGSTSVPGFAGAFTTVSPSLTLNTSNHDPLGPFSAVEMGAPGNEGIMKAELGLDLPYQQHAMRSSDLIDVVFHADLSSLTSTGSNWEVSFAAISEGASSVAVGFSLNGVTYSPVATEGLGMSEEVVTVPLGGTDLTEVFVMLSFLDTEDPSQIDNLVIKADANIIPEPGTVLLLGAGLGGLAIFGRRRS
jgi:hypothetical protein